MMFEEQVKFMCKWAVEHGNRPFTHIEKEAIKQSIDESKNIQQLLEVAFSSLLFR